MRKLLLIIVLLISYGSLYPLDITTPSSAAWKAFLYDWSMQTSRGDLLGNIALFFPFGVVGVWSLSIRNAIFRDILVLMLAFVLAFSLQLAQVWLPSRSAALVDVVWNMVGTGLGIFIAHLFAGRVGENKLTVHSTRLAPLALLILWLLTELLPLVPSLDLQKIKDALKPLIYGNEFSFSYFLIHAAGLLAAGAALSTFVAKPGRWLFGLLLFVLTGKLVVVNLAVDYSILSGLLVGFLVWILISKLLSKKLFGLTFWVMFVAWTIAALMPFSIRYDGSYNSIPFASMLEGSMQTNVQKVAQSLFIYTGLLWFVQKMVSRPNLAMSILLFWTCLLELIQMLLLGRTADITEPILIILIGWSLTSLKGHQNIQVSSALTALPVTMPNSLKYYQAPWLFLTVQVLGITLLIFGATHISSVPYNVKELISQSSPIKSALLLALTFSWVLSFPAWATKYLARSEGKYVLMPAFIFIHGIITWIILHISVPPESIHDIVGSPILNWPWEWERIGRFMALFVLWSVTLFGAVMITLRTWVPNYSRLLWMWIIISTLLFPVSYFVVIKQAATDNLYELLDGGGTPVACMWVVAGIFVLALAGTQLARAAGSRFQVGAIQGILWGIISFPLTYLALNAGFESYIIKYDQVFSAFQFLLSQDRAHYAEPTELLLRYAIVHGVLLLTIAVCQLPFFWGAESASAYTSTSPTSEHKRRRRSKARA
ncbi:MAG: VanZ family protein [Methylophilaceae bacterium]